MISSGGLGAKEVLTDRQDGQPHTDVSRRREFGREHRYGRVDVAQVRRHRSLFFPVLPDWVPQARLTV